MLKNKKILVTGGAGFIGSHIVEKLVKDGLKVRVYDNFLRGNKLDDSINKEIELIKADVRDKDKLDQSLKDINYVFHLAAYLGVDIVAENPLETMEVESIGTYNLVSSSINRGIEKIIYISTSGVYGKVEIDKGVNEDFLIAPSTSYAIAKRYNEIYLKSVSTKYNIDTFSLRYFNVYGPKQDERMVVPRFFSQALKNKPITVYGDGSDTRDFTYIDDTVRSTLLIAEKCKGNEIINVAKGDDISIQNLAKNIIKMTGSSSKIDNIKSPSHRFDFDPKKRCGDSNKLKKMTGYSPTTNLIEGLKKTYNHILKL